MTIRLPKAVLKKKNPGMKKTRGKFVTLLVTCLVLFSLVDPVRGCPPPPCGLYGEVVNTSWCDCGSGQLCIGGGARYPYYFCAGSCSTCYACQPSGTVMVPWFYDIPFCEDTGWWPTGPKCNEPSDCEITSWYRQQQGWIEHYDCKCILICI